MPQFSLPETPIYTPPPDPAPDHDVDPALVATEALLDRLFGRADERDFDIRLWDGSTRPSTTADRAPFTLHIRRRGALRRMLLPPSELSIAEAFVSRDVDIEGSLERATALGDRIAARVRSLRDVRALLPLLLALPRDDERPDPRAGRHVRAAGAARRSAAPEIRFHYDVGNDFYALWLDPSMVYTCAYFERADTDLATAQVAKLDHICRKLRLQPGQRLLDIGCGWGALAMHAATSYGVQALGITLSAAQAEWAQARIRERGLTDRCRVEVLDFRDLPPDARFDRVSSVGVTEHVPESQQEDYFRRVYDRLEPGGLFLNHCETSNNAARRRNTLGERLERWAWKRDQFIDRYVFPDARLVSLGSLIVKAERVGFETRDVESLREHYTITLRHWLRALERRQDEAIALVGERTYQVWRLYMSVSAFGFDSGAINLAQTLLSKPTPEGRSNLPLTRRDLYEAGPPR